MNREMMEIVRNQQPVTMLPDATVCDACRQMLDVKIGAILVVSDSGALLGIFTGRDAVRLAAEGADSRTTRLRDAMTPNPDTMRPRSTAIEALRLMRDAGFRHLPIVENGVLIGVVSRGDFRGLERDRLDEESGLWERIG
jgi:CBS domain-containing protein